MKIPLRFGTLGCLFFRLTFHRSLIAVFTLLASTSVLFAQGSLTPPGAPAPTMKTLDQIEARTPIDPTQPGFTLPLTIAQPGSYYFTANISATGSVAGIIVGADDVRLDLNGFALTGGSGGSARGIDVPVARKNLQIHNGTIRGWAGGGVRADNATNSILEKLRASANSGGSLVGALVVGNGSLIKDCVASNNSTNGIKTFSGTTVIGCTASSNGFNGFFLGGSVTLSDCTAHLNSVNGIKLSGNGVLDRCTASFNSASGISGGIGSMISNCAASFNGFYGIETDSGSTVSKCAVTNNSSSGIVTTIGCTVSECAAAINGGNGISALEGTSIQNCSARSNVASGIQVTTACHVFANTSRNQVGVSVYGLTNLIVRNSASGNTSAGFSISAPSLNKTGPIVTGNGTITSTSPWANFE
jgi:hypothetical protein